MKNQKNFKINWPIVLLFLFAILWLADEYSLINSTIPFGPFALIAICLIFLIYDNKLNKISKQR
jgi:hypothetical protein